MSLRGAAPFLAAVLLGLGPGAGLILSASPAAQAATTLSAPPSPPALVTTSPGPVLSQGAGGTWQTTVLVTGIDGKCPAYKPDKYEYSLQVSPASRVKLQHLSRAAPGPLGPGFGKPAVRVHSCQVRLEFSGLRQVPTAATLVLDGSSSVPLTVLRHVTFFYYLGIPAIAGGAMAALLLALALFLVRVFDREGRRQWPLRARRPFVGDFWRHLVVATGAWTVGDSWVTNLTVLGTALTTALGLISATDTLFPGVLLDRFLILNGLAVAIVTAAPLVVALYYAHWVRRYPGIPDEATLSFPGAALDAMAVALPDATQVILRDGRRGALYPGSQLSLLYAAVAIPQASRPVPLAVTASVRLPTGTAVQLPERAEVELPSGVKAQLGRLTRAHLTAAADVVPVAAQADPPRPLQVVLADGPLYRFPASATEEITLPAGLTVALDGEPGSTLVTLAGDVQAALPDGGVGRIAPTVMVPLDGVAVTLPGGIEAMVRVPGPPPAGSPAGPPADTKVCIPAPCTAALAGPGSVPFAELRYGPAAGIQAPSGAVIAAPWGASARSLNPPGPQATQLQDGHSIQVPPGSTLAVRAAGITVPSGSDIFVHGDAIVEIEPAAQGDVLTIAGGDVAVPHGQTAADATLPLPVQVVLPAGAKLTMNGIAQVTLPAGTEVTSPHCPPFEVSAHRRYFRWPQSGNSLIGTLGMVILAALVTAFGVGAELGLVAVLVVGLSGASTAGRGIMAAALAVVALFTLWYSVTAIRTLADPQPGSSMSSTAGTSFTL
jgi:hypothetical protein